MHKCSHSTACKQPNRTAVRCNARQRGQHNAMEELNCSQAMHTSIRMMRSSTSLFATNRASITKVKFRQLPTSTRDLHAHIDGASRKGTINMHVNMQTCATPTMQAREWHETTETLNANKKRDPQQHAQAPGKAKETQTQSAKLHIHQHYNTMPTRTKDLYARIEEDQSNAPAARTDTWKGKESKTAKP